MPLDDNEEDDRRGRHFSMSPTSRPNLFRDREKVVCTFAGLDEVSVLLNVFRSDTTPSLAVSTQPDHFGRVRWIRISNERLQHAARFTSDPLFL